MHINSRLLVCIFKIKACIISFKINRWVLLTSVIWRDETRQESQSNAHQQSTSSLYFQNKSLHYFLQNKSVGYFWSAFQKVGMLLSPESTVCLCLLASPHCRLPQMDQRYDSHINPPDAFCFSAETGGLRDSVLMCVLDDGGIPQNRSQTTFCRPPQKTKLASGLSVVTQRMFGKTKTHEFGRTHESWYALMAWSLTLFIFSVSLRTLLHATHMWQRQMWNPAHSHKQSMLWLILFQTHHSHHTHTHTHTHT